MLSHSSLIASEAAAAFILTSLKDHKSNSSPPPTYMESQQTDQDMDSEELRRENAGLRIKVNELRMKLHELKTYHVDHATPKRFLATPSFVSNIDQRSVGMFPSVVVLEIF